MNDYTRSFKYKCYVGAVKHSTCLRLYKLSTTGYIFDGHDKRSRGFNHKWDMDLYKLYDNGFYNR